MIDKSLDTLTAADIETLVESQVPESRFIDYKRDLPGNGREDRKEFLADVTAFANTRGGHLVYGVEEAAGVPTDAPGLPGVNADDEKLRLEQLIRDGIAPRIPGVGTRVVGELENGPALVIHVPQSPSGPHMVTLGGSSRFYARASNGRYQLDVQQIRDAFIASETLAERMREFRADRVAKIAAGDTPIPSDADAAKVVLHLVVPSMLAIGEHIDLNRAMDAQDLKPISDRQGYGDRYNFDGFVRLARHQQSYAQVFRTGAIELADWLFLNGREEKYIPVAALEERLIARVDAARSLYRRLQLGPPMVVMLSFVHVRDYEIPFKDSWGMPIDGTHPVDRDMLIVPEIIDRDFTEEPDVLLRPALDQVWQSAGFAGCMYFDNEGRWRPRT